MELGDGIISVGSTEFRIVSNSIGSSALSQFTKIFQKTFRSKPEEIEGNFPGDLGGLCLVAGKPGSDRPDLSKGSGNLSDNGCFRSRLGIPAGQQDGVGIVVSGAVELAYKLQGIVHSIDSDSEVQKIPEEQDNSLAVRQQDSGGVYPEARRNTLIDSAASSQTVVNGDASVQDSINSIFPTGPLQLCGGQPFQGSSASGLASEKQCHQDDLREIRNTSDRSFCVKQVEGSSKICFDGCQRLRGSLDKCLKQELVGRSGLGISSTSFNSQSSSTPEQSEGPVLGSDISVG